MCRSPRRFVLLVTLLCACPSAEAASLWVGGGGTGTSDFGFRGGWGLAAGIETRIAPSASALVRADYHTIPTGGDGSRGYIVVDDASALGAPDERNLRAELVSLAGGLRLQRRDLVRSYLDVLLGVGWVNDRAATPRYAEIPSGRRSRDDINVMLSFGTGLSLRPRGAVGAFADIHYDFYFTETSSKPIIPVRIGLIR
jgi:hypothetical protein